jgi:predicted acylesterase/phospholipase RssA
MRNGTSRTALLVALLATLCAGCVSTISGQFNGKPAPPIPSDDSLVQRPLCTSASAHPRTAFFLTISGGGSRSAYFGARVLSELKNVDGADLAGDIDVISSVSGGSLAAALYGISTDTQNGETWRPTWNDTLIEKRLAANLKDDMAEQLIRPGFLGNYLVGPANRTDTLFSALNKDLLFGTDPHRRALTLGDFNPNRPQILLNATVATAEGATAFRPRPFGSLFTFSYADLDSIGVDYTTFPMAQAVAASSAFPGLLSPVVLHRYYLGADEEDLGTNRYLHLMDGGNVDNLGLLAVKRALLENDHQLLRACDQIVVVTVDAFGAQGVHRDDQPTKRSVSGWFIDGNTLMAAFDELLAANRTRLLAEFKSRMFTPPADSEQCRKDDLPWTICEGGVRVDWKDVNNQLRHKLYFVHLSFDSEEIASPPFFVVHDRPDDFVKSPIDMNEFVGERRALRYRLKHIPTTFGLSVSQQSDITIYTKLLFNPGNVCLTHLRELLTSSVRNSKKFYDIASESCDETSYAWSENDPRRRNTEEIDGDRIRDPAHKVDTDHYQPLSTVMQREAFWNDVLKYYGWNDPPLSHDEGH